MSNLEPGSRLQLSSFLAKILARSPPLKKFDLCKFSQSVDAVGVKEVLEALNNSNISSIEALNVSGNPAWEAEPSIVELLNSIKTKQTNLKKFSDFLEPQ